ncbi:M1 family metallopeptidase [Sphingomonas sp.]|uniref:M1 family metallopeptidase n=1 Tax=Sphingomonas sp. TaxID=28214 RepID=UPI002BA9440D|nr:M1 family metallopeptidase [Sphingomonas sp.]HWK36028.1 M1 family metallopeptidase [Sphingomonas sp.]
MKFQAVTALLLTVSAPAMAAGELPRTVLPVAYDIRVEPDAAAMTFTGSETIDVDVKQATSTIVLNAAELNISSATFDGAAAKFATDEAAQTLTVTLPKPASVGRHKLAFAWKGKINTSAAGFFAIDYSDDDGTKQRMLATQFEAPDARRFAPMWDEPSFKAKFTLSAVAPRGQTAFSNMPAAPVAQISGGKQLYRFGETPVMSSYLLFLGIGDVERKTVMAGQTEIGVITRRGVVDQGDYALKAAKDLFAYYNDYFGQPYPLPKLDMIAGPGSSQFFGAMENWGAIFYFEPELLFDAKRATVSNQQRIYTVVAHEMAHQWFGDLVTMRWWDDLWLNEGFASWMEGKATGDLNPDWHLDAAAVATDRESAMRLDAVATSHPIIRKVETVDQIGEAFDAITYEKGQQVINMLESTVGADPFRDGVRRYMARYKHGNTVTDQLWAEISAAAGHDVAPMMHDFTLQAGVPLVSVAGAACVGGKTNARFSQTRFGLDDASKAATDWRVPVTLSAGGTVASATVRGASPQPASVDGCGTLVINPGKRGYYRTRYDAAGHAAIVRGFGTLAVADQLGTLADDLALGMSGDQDLARWFETVGVVKRDADPLVWSLVLGQVGRVGDLYDGTPLGERYRAKAMGLIAPAMDRFGLEPRGDDTPLVTNLRELLVGALGSTGDATVLAAARGYFGKLKGDSSAIPPSIRRPMLRTYALNATPAEWDALLALTRAETSPVVRTGYISLLGVARDDALAKRALDLVKADEFTAPQRASLLAAIASGHPDLAFDFAVANADLVNGLLETSTRSSFIVGLAAGSNDPAMIGRVEAWAAKNLPEGSRGPALRTVTAIKNRATYADRLRPAVTAWAGN